MKIKKDQVWLRKADGLIVQTYEVYPRNKIITFTCSESICVKFFHGTEKDWNCFFEYVGEL